ncbi:NADP-dependent glyceraldehyde-3-phosphate dehydrogenase [Bacillus sp. Marseille-Q3570]|uniref:NADP-dependent glyceraldehyde-3-phosphate dehydrogenase n=1 Tax=Bacillus sp. Marseille-Q3570 TaxID=2963522 RepID=UPI0021B6F653|nr:NADP-dependent glyceraldehyde-3-phosphate dehydrogenase [Bacillus sp. Marseille-Q3570]
MISTTLLSKEKEIYSVTGEERIGVIPIMEKESVEKAIHKAKEAQPQWAEIELYKRADILHDWADQLLKNQANIAEVISKEVGKGYNAAKKEVTRTADLIRYVAEEGCRMHGELLKGDSFKGGKATKMAMVEQAPLGVVLAISPFNYPVNLAASKIAPALISGNAVVFKPASQGALSGLLMVEALLQTDIPQEVVQTVTGKGSEIGDLLVTHPDIDMITFTGSSATGQAISQKAKMKPVVLELGGKDPAFVLEDADLSLAAEQIVSGAFSYSGQRCTAIKRVLADQKIADELIGKIKELVEQLSVGSPEENATITPLINTQAADYVEELIEEALEKGAAPVLNHKRVNNLISPALLDHVTTDMRIAWEEPFGPVLPILRFKEEAEMIKIANQSEYGLQASIFTKNVQKAFFMGSKLNVGSVQLNAKTERGPDHFPFIGAKSSGLGSQGIRRSIESMTRDKLFVLNL